MNEFKDNVHWANHYQVQISELTERTIPTLVAMFASEKSDATAKHIKQTLDANLELLRQKQTNVNAFLNAEAPAKVYAADRVEDAPQYEDNAPRS